MGNVESGIDKGLQLYIKQEFDRVKKDPTKDYLNLGEMLQLKSQDEYPFSFAHLGILFVLDDDRDGRVTLEEFLKFGQICNLNMKNYKTYEFQSQLQAFTTLQLWHELKKPDGEGEIIGWVGRLLYENEEVRYFENKPGIPFIRLDTVKHLYDFCNVKVMNGMDLQMFFSLLQEYGEEKGMMVLECEEQDGYVPIVICQDFAGEFIRGLSKLMKEIGFDGIV